MSKITLGAICTLLRLVLSLVPKVIRLLYSVVDLVDDGVINQSAEMPSWMDKVASAINQFEDACRLVSQVEDEIVL